MRSAKQKPRAYEAEQKVTRSDTKHNAESDKKRHESNARNDRKRHESGKKGDTKRLYKAATK